MTREEQKELSLQLFEWARKLANEVGTAWDEFYDENKDAAKYWMPLEVVTLMTFFRRHVELVTRKRVQYEITDDDLRKFWYAQLEMFSQAGYEVVHAALTGRLHQLDEWRRDIESTEETKVCSRDRQFPNKAISDEEWELLKRKLQ